MSHYLDCFQYLLDTFVKIATIVTPIITGILGRKIANQLKVKESIYQKREVIYRELYVYIQKCYGAFREYEQQKNEKRKENLNNQIRELSNFIITEKIYFSKKVEKLTDDIKGKYAGIYIEDKFINLDLELINKQDELRQQIQIELEIKE